MHPVTLKGAIALVIAILAPLLTAGAVIFFGSPDPGLQFEIMFAAVIGIMVSIAILAFTKGQRE